MVVGWLSAGLVVQDFLWPLRAGLQVVTRLAVFSVLPFLLAFAVRVADFLRLVVDVDFFAMAVAVFFFVVVAVVFFLVVDLVSVLFFLRSLPFTGSDFCAVGVLACPVACANGVKDNDVNNNAQSVNDHFFICATEQPSE